MPLPLYAVDFRKTHRISIGGWVIRRRRVHALLFKLHPMLLLLAAAYLACVEERRKKEGVLKWSDAPGHRNATARAPDKPGDDFMKKIVIAVYVIEYGRYYHL